MEDHVTNADSGNTTTESSAEFSGSALRLIRPDNREPDSYKLERRRALRRKISGRVTALRVERDGDGSRNCICPLEMQDISDTGVGARSQDRAELGSRMTIFFPPHGADKGFDLVGEIVRCERADWGWDVGIRLDQFSTACA